MKSAPKMIIHILTLLGFTLIPTYCARRDNAVEKYFQVCQRSHPDMVNCVRESIEALRPRLTKGIKDIGIPPLEPLKISEIKLEEDTGAIALYSHYKDIEVRGLSDWQLRDLDIDLNENFLQLKIYIPNLVLTANYKISGKIMMMPLQGEGPCMGNFTDIELTSFIKTGRRIKNGKEYLTVEDIGANFVVGDTKINLDNLFNGDPELGSAVNKFLNENWQSILSEIQPTLEKKLANTLKLIATKLFESFTYEELLPP